METFWFAVVVLMLSLYVMLDGFDFGTGIVYLAVSRTEEERRMVLQAIGPVWNGNEVWLIASGGVIFFAFPKAYAAGFSGFYLALILVLWLLMVRGLALELRSHFASPLWRQFWDTAFSGASALLAFVFGVALGNLIRGVPLDEEGFFHVPFWTTFTPDVAEPGIFDWFTICMGLTAVAILAHHGSAYLTMKTTGTVHRRARKWADKSVWTVAGVSLAMTLTMVLVQPIIHDHYTARPWGALLNGLALLGLGGMLYGRQTRKDGLAFAASCVLIVGMLGSSAWGLYPNILVSSTDPAFSLTVYNSAASPHGLAIGIQWFSVGCLLMVGYMIAMYRSFRGKITSDMIGDGHY
ncbi:MAG: cytochrome d ubiquinol oxidase subunit II [Nitrospirae bacterium]|nr:MAG: cytochrome d ubiquinol oxidase subunit II [Nitrospirota bacterium]